MWLKDVTFYGELGWPKGASGREIKNSLIYRRLASINITPMIHAQ